MGGGAVMGAGDEPAGELVGGSAPTAPARVFSLDAFTRDDRLRLFAFTTADRRVDYLWVLRALERSRANYVTQVHAGDIARLLSDLAARPGANAAARPGANADARPGANAAARPGATAAASVDAGLAADSATDPATDAPRLTSDEVTPLLDQLHEWRVVDRSFDGSRAATLAEYRNRHYNYQFTQAGYRAYQAVEEVLGAGLDDAQLSRLVWPELLADLASLPPLIRAADAETVYRTLRRLDATLADMADRAAHFYLMLAELARGQDAGADAFLAHKDALLAHMQEFSSELARFGPKLVAAVGEVERAGAEMLAELAAEADERLFATPAERLADWRQRWAGLAGWFVGAVDRPSEAARLQDGTVAAIGALLAQLRSLTDSRRGGVSQTSQLRHLATWFTAAPSDEAAHALFDVTFALGAPRHVSIAHPDPELIPTRRSWWDAPAVEVSRTLVETGKAAAPGPPARIDRNRASVRLLHDHQVARRQDRTAAADALRGIDLAEHVLTEAQTALLIDLLSIALAARVPVSGRVSGGAGGTPSGGARGFAPTTATSDGVRLTLRPAATSTTVRTVRGELHIDRMAVVLQ